MLVCTTAFFMLWLTCFVSPRNLGYRCIFAMETARWGIFWPIRVYLWPRLSIMDWFQIYISTKRPKQRTSKFPSAGWKPVCILTLSSVCPPSPDCLIYILILSVLGSHPSVLGALLLTVLWGRSLGPSVDPSVDLLHAKHVLQSLSHLPRLHPE